MSTTNEKESIQLHKWHCYWMWKIILTCSCSILEVMSSVAVAINFNITLPFSAMKKILQLAVSKILCPDVNFNVKISVTVHLWSSLPRNPVPCDFYQLPTIFWHFHNYAEAGDCSENAWQNCLLSENVGLAKWHERTIGSDTDPYTVWWLQDKWRNSEIIFFWQNVVLQAIKQKHFHLGVWLVAKITRSSYDEWLRRCWLTSKAKFCLPLEFHGLQSSKQFSHQWWISRQYFYCSYKTLRVLSMHK